MKPPKQKAKILVDKYYELFAEDLENTISIYEAIDCAKIAVNEILEELKTVKYEIQEWIEYWQDVKTELNKL